MNLLKSELLAFVAVVSCTLSLLSCTHSRKLGSVETRDLTADFLKTEAVNMFSDFAMFDTTFVFDSTQYSSSTKQLKPSTVRYVYARRFATVRDTAASAASVSISDSTVSQSLTEYNAASQSTDYVGVFFFLIILILFAVMVKKVFFS